MTVIHDDFNRANASIGVNPTAEGWSWTAVVGSADVNTNRFRTAVSSGSNYSRAQTDLSTTDHYAQAKVYLTSGGSAFNAIDLIVRFATSATTFYMAQVLSLSGTINIKIYKVVTGTATQIGSNLSFTYASGDTIKFEVVGTSLKTYQNGTLLDTRTDSSITTGTRCGLGGYSSGGSDIAEADDFEAGDSTAAATQVALSGPSSGPNGVASSNFTATLNGNPTGTIVFTPTRSAGAGTFTPTSLSFSGTTTTGTFTETPSNTTTRDISGTNDGGLTGPTPITYTVTTPIAVTDSNWKWSPYNWYTSGSSYKESMMPGAYFNVGFSGTSASLTVDVSALVAASTAAGNYPYLIYSVDNGAQVTVLLTSSTTSIAVASGLASANHTLECVIKAASELATSWASAASAVRITGLQLDAGASSVAGKTRTKNAIFYGDSITAGWWITAQTLAGSNGCLSGAYQLGWAIDANMGVVGFASQGYVTAVGGTDIPAFTGTYDLYSSGKSRLSGGVLSPAPDYMFCMQGANGSVTATQVETAMSNMRTIGGSSARIFVVVPCGRQNATAILAGIVQYQANHPSDTKTYTIDFSTEGQEGFSGTASQYSIDGGHPNALGHTRFAGKMAAAVMSAIGGGGTTGMLYLPSLEGL